MSDSESQAGGAICAEVRSGAVSMATHTALTIAYTSNQASYSNVCADLDEETAGSNPATPTSSQATPNSGTWPFIGPRPVPAHGGQMASAPSMRQQTTMAASSRSPLITSNKRGSLDDSRFRLPAQAGGMLGTTSER